MENDTSYTQRPEEDGLINYPASTAEVSSVKEAEAAESKKPD